MTIHLIFSIVSLDTRWLGGGFTCFVCLLQLEVQTFKKVSRMFQLSHVGSFWPSIFEDVWNQIMQLISSKRRHSAVDVPVVLTGDLILGSSKRHGSLSACSEETEIIIHSFQWYITPRRAMIVSNNNGQKNKQTPFSSMYSLQPNGHVLAMQHCSKVFIRVHRLSTFGRWWEHVNVFDDLMYTSYYVA